MVNETKDSTERGNRKLMVGVVTSDKMDKTIVVKITTKVKHPLYGKFVKRSKKYMVHDQEQQASIGDTVKIMEVRPISKNKRWRLTEVVEKSVIL